MMHSFSETVVFLHPLILLVLWSLTQLSVKFYVKFGNSAWILVIWFFPFSSPFSNTTPRIFPSSRDFYETGELHVNYGIRMKSLTDLRLLLKHSNFCSCVMLHARVWQTDRQTDRQTDSFLIAIPRLHSMQRGKKSTGCFTQKRK